MSQPNMNDLDLVMYAVQCACTCGNHLFTDCSSLKSVCTNTIQHSTILVKKKEKDCSFLQMCTGIVKVVRISVVLIRL